MEDALPPLPKGRGFRAGNKMKFLEREHGPITSAGFVQIDSGGVYCYGRSGSLKIESKKGDNELLKWYHLFRE